MTEDRDDAGVTLLELLVAMSIMSVFTALFTAGVVQMYRTAATAEATQALQSRLNLTFERLDAEIRYASAITDPDPAPVDGRGISVEYLNLNGAEPLCTQLRLLNGALLRRTWTTGKPPSGGWRTLATGVTGSTPFAVRKTANRFQLRLTLTVEYATSGPAAGEHTTEFLFTALNNRAGEAGTACTTDGRSRP
ncbi:prepilin-type N-terminal cleavage/methylation domain-containing protein [Actinoplanes sp. NPDC024001]|uniref:PulJ/GspJ family protein n=1 Tax=Actinoplanes sp. NPDC024001 TaxID=3154598 RepID=UPI0033EBFE24